MSQATCIRRPDGWGQTLTFALVLCALLFVFICSVQTLGAQEAQRGRTQLSGIVVDTSGAALAEAVVQVQNANGNVITNAHSDANGSFAISGLAAGEYRLVVSHADFETKEIPVTIGTTRATAPLRITLVVSAVSSTITVQGREDDLVGIADSGTQGTVGANEIENRPILRSGEVLETVPGLIITQHAGGGKANQYFLRGFNLDHGTDFAVFLDDMPLNLPTHAHGEGYADMNTVIPEFVRRVNFEKGPYYADVGDYGSAGAAHLEFFKTLPENFFQVEGGMYGYGRAVTTANGTRATRSPRTPFPLSAFSDRSTPPMAAIHSDTACRPSGTVAAPRPRRRSWPMGSTTISICSPISPTT